VFEIGTTLREARRARGLEISECEQHTKIRGKYLRALENEQFDVLPSPTYVRGFLRTYAEFLDLDSTLVLDEHHSRFGAVNPVTGEVERAGRPPRRPARRARPRHGRTEARLLWLAVGGVLGMGLLVWMGVGNTSEPPPALPPSDPSAQAGPAAPPSAPAPASAREGSAIPRGEAPQRLQVVLVGEGDSGSYVEVRGRSAEGREVFRGTVAPGTSRSFVVSRGIWVRSGNTDGLSISVNGRSYELTGGVADFLVNAEGVQRVRG
jgi:cytoskeleton protein RodZ